MRRARKTTIDGHSLHFSPALSSLSSLLLQFPEFSSAVLIIDFIHLATPSPKRGEREEGKKRKRKRQLITRMGKGEHSG